MVRRILFGFGLSTFSIDAVLYWKMRQSLEFGGATQLKMAAVGFVCLLVSAVMQPEEKP